MARQSITVADRIFSTKKSLLEELRRILHSTPLDTCVGARDHHLLLGLMQRHPHAATKIGCGIEGFFVFRSVYGSPCFSVRRRDGSEEVFSYKKVVSYAPKSDHRARIRDSFRTAIRPQVLAVKEAAVGTECPVSGLSLSIGVTEIDHAGDGFSALMAQFLGGAGRTIDEIEYTWSLDGTQFFLRDQELDKAWSQWHRIHAKLVAVHRDAHFAKHFPEKAAERSSQKGGENKHEDDQSSNSTTE